MRGPSACRPEAGKVSGEQRCVKADPYQFSLFATTVALGAFRDAPDFDFTFRFEGIFEVPEFAKRLPLNIFGVVCSPSAVSPPEAAGCTSSSALSTELDALLDLRNVSSTFSTHKTLNNRAKLADVGLASSCA